MAKYTRMRPGPYIIILLILATAYACGGGRKTMKHMPARPAVEVKEAETQNATEAESPILEVEEKLVTVNEVPPDPSRYFVIIGSFRNPDNAEKHQQQIAADGFTTSVLVRNEAGLYRVSVLATDRVDEARREILRIRSRFPKYADTWLLIQKK